MMVKLKCDMRLGLMVGLCLLLGLYPWSVVLSAEEPITISKSEEYFPDTVGSRWTYRGQINEGPLQSIAPSTTPLFRVYVRQC